MTSSLFRADQEFMKLKLSDLSIVATLGVGGFGRVELVRSHDLVSLTSLCLTFDFSDYNVSFLFPSSLIYITWAYYFLA